mgnify:CR=1 FL=1
MGAVDFCRERSLIDTVRPSRRVAPLTTLESNLEPHLSVHGICPHGICRCWLASYCLCHGPSKGPPLFPSTCAPRNSLRIPGEPVSVR